MKREEVNILVSKSDQLLYPYRRTTTASKQKPKEVTIKTKYIGFLLFKNRQRKFGPLLHCLFAYLSASKASKQYPNSLCTSPKY
jgi:hypothetical protein